MSLIHFNYIYFFSAILIVADLSLSTGSEFISATYVKIDDTMPSKNHHSIDDGAYLLSAVAGPTPAFSKDFSEPAVLLGETTVLSFTIDNTANSVAVDDLAFSDPLPAGLTFATPINFTDTCGAIITTIVGSTSIFEISSGNVAAQEICTTSIEIEAIAIGIQNNITGDLTSSAGNSGVAKATITVVSSFEDGDLAINKGNSLSTIDEFDTVTYTITVNNLGDTSAQDAEILDLLPDTLDTTTAIWSCTPSIDAICTASGNGDITDVVSIPSGGNLLYTITARVIGTEGATVCNTATVIPPASFNDLIPANNRNTDCDPIGLFSDGFEGLINE